ncbi:MULTISPECIES: 4-hydroxy-tetrahydrodipicolinate synthase [unclassified Streptomyces]|uniref:4-hydroxy-tetrahydrodipicolinate synthase n=1 Tax=unclassified Streptomyces TaxID=2593676 RepID=UPI0016615197|nr:MULTISPECIES: 4-hydroxy-tetrahydrodipicolinate synthase [unclassified Streptomyces]MBD0709241.1 4-hydroxy-tetrahydrodipicolinate synthase [Streptomyces sp. CBMA291]MBD0713572.1 4-hydroxy-tetrahydrodipicolinate synthase [Streptomyces sp. CBMA370]
MSTTHPARTPRPVSTTRPFGRALCAMVTPFAPDGGLDLDQAGELAVRLVAEGCDGLVLNGTTGESPTTSDAEKTALVRAVRAAVGPGVPLVAGVGTADTRSTVEAARAAERAGADGLLVVTPYYSRPPQDAVAAHFLKVADAAGLPLMVYDIPGRTGTRVEPATMRRLAEHPRITAVKDCSYDLLASSRLIAETPLAYYSGCEELNLPLYAVGGAGFVSTVANVAPGPLAAVLDAFDAGDTRGAALLNARLLPLFERMMAGGLPGTVTVKALLGGALREPLLPAGREAAEALRATLDAVLLQSREAR